jgi:hypothetical protein
MASPNHPRAKPDETSTATHGVSPRRTARQTKTSAVTKWSKPFCQKQSVYPLFRPPLYLHTNAITVDYFDSTAPAKPPKHTEDDLVEQFATEYYEAQEAKQQQNAARAKPAPVPGAPPILSGPKLGGSKSARAKMHKLLTEEAAKKKR